MDGSDRNDMSVEAVQVKEEYEWTNSAEWWDVSEAAAWAGLYADHAVKRELVLGPEVLQPPDSAFKTVMHVKLERVKEERERGGRGGEPALRDCVVRLERHPALEGLLQRHASCTHIPYIQELNNINYAKGSCHTCRKTCTLNSHLTEHVVHIHTPTSPKRGDDCGRGRSPPRPPAPRVSTCVCDVCRRTFPHKLQLTRHIKLHMRVKPPQPENVTKTKKSREISCEICKRKFSSMQYFNMHKLSKTCEIIYSCPICKKQFCRSNALKKHQSVHTGEKPFSCDSCGKEFRLLGCLTRHRVIHTGVKKYSCKICKKMFLTLNSLRRHERSHKGEKPFCCEICQKKFAHKANLRNHERVHKGERRMYPCEICNKEYTTAFSLKIHKETHGGVKRYSCATCEKKFMHLGNLTIQTKQVHMRDKPHSCDICEKKFSSRGDLTKHRRVHTGEKPYACVCGKKFTDSSTLRRHERIHMDVKPHQCDICQCDICAFTRFN